MKNQKFPFAILCDTDKALAKAYGAYNEKQPGYANRYSYLVSPEGKIEKVFDKVSPKKHAQEVLDAIP